MTRDRLTWLVLPALLLALLVGCNRKKPVAQDTPADPPAAPATAHGEPQTPDGGPTPVIGGDRPTDPPTPPHDPPPHDPPAIDPEPQDTGRALGRSPFPAEGEDLSGPIAARRFSDHDPFENLIDPADIPDVVPWEEASNYVGHEITVEGRIVNIGHSRDGKTHFLNYHPEWRGKFYLVVFNDLATTLDGSVDDVFHGRLIRVRGLVEPHRGRPQIKILSMDQVEFMTE